MKRLAAMKIEEDEARAANGGINPQQPSHASDVYGTRYPSTSGPGHPPQQTKK